MVKTTLTILWIIILFLIIATTSFLSCGDDNDHDFDQETGNYYYDDDDWDDDDDDDTVPTNYALDFDGTDDFIIVQNDPSLWATTEMTIEAWVYVQSVTPIGFNCLVGHNYFQSNEENQGWELSIRNMKFSFNILNDSENIVQADTIVPVYQWIHVAGTYDGSNIALWVGGTKVDEIPYTTNIEQASSNLFIGMRYFYKNFFYGMVDEVRLSNIARYDASFIPENEFSPDSYTLALWHFNEGTGNIVYDEINSLHDGTIVGPTWNKRQ